MAHENSYSIIAFIKMVARSTRMIDRYKSWNCIFLVEDEEYIVLVTKKCVYFFDRSNLTVKNASVDINLEVH